MRLALSVGFLCSVRGCPKPVSRMVKTCAFLMLIGMAQVNPKTRENN